MFKFNDMTTNYLNDFSRTVDARDQTFQDIQQAKAGLIPARPLLERYKNQFDPRDQAWHDLNTHNNRIDFATFQPACESIKPLGSELLPKKPLFPVYEPQASFSPLGILNDSNPFKLK